MIDLYLDRQGQPMTAEEWSRRMLDVAYKHVAVSAGDDWHVSTVWFGANLGDDPPLIFETMVFGGPLDDFTERWPNEDAARAGHDQVVARVRELLAVS